MIIIMILLLLLIIIIILIMILTVMHSNSTRTNSNRNTSTRTNHNSNTNRNHTNDTNTNDNWARPSCRQQQPPGIHMFVYCSITNAPCFSSSSVVVSQKGASCLSGLAPYLGGTAFREAVPDGWEVMWRHYLRWRPFGAEAF